MKKARTLDVLLDFAASHVPESEEELDAALREEGIDPEAAIARMRKKYAAGRDAPTPPAPITPTPTIAPGQDTRRN